MSINGFGDIKQQGSIESWDLYEPTITFQSENGTLVVIQADIRDLEFDGAEIQFLSIVVNGSQTEDLVNELSGEDVIDRLLLSSYSTSFMYNINRKSLSDDEINVIAKALGLFNS